MNIDEAFPSRFFKGEDFCNLGEVHMAIAAVTYEKMQDGTTKPALSFLDQKKMLVLNRTNANAIKAVYGRETDSWLGKAILLYHDRVQFGADLRDAVRVKIPPAAPAAVPAPEPPHPVDPKAAADGAAAEGEDIPFC